MMSAVLMASIAELCSLDHGNDPAAIATWTANKTPDGVSAMLRNPQAELFVAEHDGAIAAVGCILGGREVGLNYVHPSHRFAGVSRALLAAMETVMQARGTTHAILESTATAHRFYLAQGWVDGGPLHGGRFAQAYPMSKAL